MKKQKTYLFVDGSNLYAAQYELFGPEKFLDFSKLITEVEKRLKIKFDKIYFYASYSPRPKRLTKKAKFYLKNEALFYRNVKKIKKAIFFKGYRSKTSGKEKEVDVKLAVDIVNFAHLKKYNQLYLFSGDADFMHALKIAEGLCEKVFVLALQNRIPNRLSYFYLTMVFLFSKKMKQTLSRKQKIKLIYLKKDNLVRKTFRK